MDSRSRSSPPTCARRCGLAFAFAIASTLAPAFAALPATAAAAAACAPRTELVERFVPADCEACWAQGERIAGDALALDWIVPSTHGDRAPLSAAAIAEALPRAGALDTARTLLRRHALPTPAAMTVAVEDGPAWNGYIALRLRVERRGDAPANGAAGFVALVERVPAGEEGTPIERWLVRTVVGPLGVDGEHASTEHVHALRIPVGARVERLTAAGWVERPAGTVVAAAIVVPEGCSADR